MRTINIHEAKTTLSNLLRLVEEEGQHIRIARNGRPVAELIPLPKKHDPFVTNPRLQGIALEDPMLPLDEEDWPLENR